MKKKTVRTILIICMLCVCFTACGKSESVDDIVIDEQITDIDDPDDLAETAAVYSDYDYASQVQFMFEHSRWLSLSENVAYAFCDLDNNGRMEVIVCERNEYGESAPPKFYEISSDYDGLNECSFESNCYIYDLDDSICESMYIDPDTGARSYLMKYDEEFEGKSLFYYYELSLSDGSVSQYAVCLKNPDGYCNYRFEKIDDELFDLENEVGSYFEGRSPYDAPVFLFDPLEGDGLHEKISDSINTFLK